MGIALTRGVALDRVNNFDDTAVWLSGITGVIFLIIGLALLVLLVWAIISTLVDSDTSAGGKLLWIIFELWAPLFGAVAWLVVGRKGHLNRLLGIDKGRARHTVPTSVGQHSDVAPRSARTEPPEESRGDQQDQTGLGHA